MVGIEFLVSFVLFMIVNASPNDNDETAIMKQDLKQLEKTVSDLQKHIVAKEQKQTAVLSSLLSRLTETTDQLANTTDELVRLQHNYTVLENEVSILKKNYTSLEPAGTSGREVAFEASMVKKGNHNHLMQIPANSTLLFPATSYNKGGCWDPVNGVFTASVNGTYLFWVDLTWTKVREFTLYMKRNDEEFGKANGYLAHPPVKTMLSYMSITPLLQMDEVRFVTDETVPYYPSLSSCGGMLLHSSQQR